MIKVLIVDDSALMRSLLSEIIRSDAEFHLIGAAPDAFVAKDLVNQFKPDVISLDVEMPRVDGLTFLDRLMKARPTPVVMISSLTEQGAEVTLRALELGAVDFIAKPKIDLKQGIEGYREDILEKLRQAAKANVNHQRRVTPTASAKPLNFKTSEKLFAIGASTGGTEAIREVLLGMPVDSPAIVITQHMPVGFTKTFAARLDKLCAIKVKEAEADERILPGHAYIAPGDRHMKIVRSGADYRIRLDDGPRVSGHKPSVDVMFESLAEAAGSNVIAAILTGMGKDGTYGMQLLHQAGAYTIAQDEQSSVIFGMPREAIKAGAVQQICSLDQVTAVMLQHLAKVGKDYRI